MKSKEFIVENIITEDEFKRYLDTIKRHCQPYLQQNPWPLTKPLWRGMRDSREFILKEVRKTDRKTVDTPKPVHDTLNHAFSKLFGIPYRNGLFATGKKADALSYGNEFLIFPAGRFKFIWSPQIKDIWDELVTKFYINRDHNQSKEELERIYEYFTTTDLYRVDSLPTAIRSGHEIMIWCDAYYAINNDSFGSYSMHFRKEFEGYMHEE